ncbi:MAG: purine-nucleoside phosphorylase [bacterium]
MGNNKQQCLSLIAEKSNHFKPDIAIVLGSGLGAFADQVDIICDLPYQDLPGFPEPGVGGHAGCLRLGHIGGTAVALLMGRAHYYEHGNPAAMRLPVEVLAGLGCDTLLLTNAAGSLLHAAPGSVMMLTDHLNFTGQSPLFGIDSDHRFVDMSTAYNPEIQKKLVQIAEQNDITLHQGVYAWMSGPQFETPSEIKALRIMGADAVGMSTVPEVILGQFYGMKVGALSIITNYAAGMLSLALSHDQTIEYAAKAAGDVRTLLTEFVSQFKRSN